MAANDYYDSSHPPTGQSHRQNDAPLPAIPSNQTQHSVSPISASPFDDRQYAQNSSSGALGGFPDSYSNTEYNPHSQYNSTSHLNNGPDRYDAPGRHPDPFTDQNAIPLQHQPKMEGGSPTRYNEDPERYGLGVEPARKHKKKGMFSGKVTWVVYILTTVQIGVFVGELIKNGMSQSALCRISSEDSNATGRGPEEGFC